MSEAESTGGRLKERSPGRANAQGFGVVINLEGNHLMNAKATTPEINHEDATTPEALFTIPAGIPLNVDVLQTSVTRMQGLVGLLLYSGSDGKSFHSHSEVMSALWLMEGQLQQLDQVLESAGVAQ